MKIKMSTSQIPWIRRTKANVWKGTESLRFEIRWFCLFYTSFLEIFECKLSKLVSRLMRELIGSSIKLGERIVETPTIFSPFCAFYRSFYVTSCIFQNSIAIVGLFAGQIMLSKINIRFSESRLKSHGQPNGLGCLVRMRS